MCELQQVLEAKLQLVGALEEENLSLRLRAKLLQRLVVYAEAVVDTLGAGAGSSSSQAKAQERHMLQAAVDWLLVPGSTVQRSGDGGGSSDGGSSKANPAGSFCDLDDSGLLAFARRATVEDIRLVYANRTAELALLLPRARMAEAAGGRLHSNELCRDAAEAVQAKILQLRSFYYYMLLYNTDSFHRVHFVDLETGGPVREVGPEYWRMVIESMDLSDEQLEMMVANTRLLFERLAHVQRVKQQVLAHAAATGPGSELEVAEALQGCLRASTAVVAVHTLTNTRAITPLQHAALLVSSYPVPAHSLKLIAVGETMLAERQQRAKQRVAAAGAGRREP